MGILYFEIKSMLYTWKDVKKIIKVITNKTSCQVAFGTLERSKFEFALFTCYYIFNKKLNTSVSKHFICFHFLKEYVNLKLTF